jgi:hypothetical protein
MGTEIDAVPVAGLAANFSPMPLIAPPGFGSARLGTVIPGGSGANGDAPRLSAAAPAVNPIASGLPVSVPTVASLRKNSCEQTRHGRHGGIMVALPQAYRQPRSLRVIAAALDVMRRR